ncbi:LysR family transcriptional regulator [Novosphingobium profundi]|uniref:LysR family transcriptional regulator n=1 Tax=Novosphingobium profundi TaxID=1774954 RepID=UPI001CFDDBFE|nr:LysR family transcriptional regulator [Novosphingobium profundi]
MDIRQLERFVEVASLGSVNRAAEALSVSQPSLSRSLQMLEESLGAPLFTRGARGVELTPHGIELLPRARLILAERDRAVEAVRAGAGQGRETLHIGTDAAFAMLRLPRALAALARSHPQVQVQVREGPLGALLDALREGAVRLVFGARGPYVDLEGLAFETLAMESAGVIMRADHPLAGRARVGLADLVQERWIVPDHPALVAGWREMFARAELIEPPIALRTSSLHVVKGCLLEGPFVSLGDRSSFAAEIASGQLVSLDLGLSRYERPTGLFTRPEGRLSTAEHALVAALREA